MCQFFVPVGSHILRRKVQSEIWERIQSNIRRQPGTVARCCVLCILPRLDFVFLKSMVSYLSATGYKIQIYETRTLPNMIKHCWVIDSKPVLCATRIKKPTVPLFQDPNYQHATTVCKSQFQFWCKFEIIVSCHRFAPVICFVLFVNLCWRLSV